MASIRFLWINRATFPITSIRFYRAWAKRALLLGEVIRRNNRRKQFLKRGAAIDETAEIGEARIEGKIRLLSIGRLSFLGRVDIALHDEVRIGQCVCLNDGVEILTASHNVADPQWRHVTGRVVIDDYAWIGTGAMILPGVHIGRGAVVGARAVVTKSVLPGTIVVGNPAKPTSKKRCDSFMYNPCEFLAANRAWLQG